MPSKATPFKLLPISTLSSPQRLHATKPPCGRWRVLTTTSSNGSLGLVGLKASPALGPWTTGLRLPNTVATTSSSIALPSASRVKFNARMLGFMRMKMARRGLLLPTMSLPLLSS
ncbi:hypothetical protein LINPERHAP2_LOCUS33851 [Linum perenne]